MKSSKMTVSKIEARDPKEQLAQLPAQAAKQVPHTYLNKQEVAELLRKKIRTIDNWMKRGILPYYKIGRSVTFKLRDVEAHLDIHYRVCPKPLAA